MGRERGVRRGFMAEGVPGLTSKARLVKTEEKKNFRQGTSLGKGEGTSKPYEDTVISLTEESVPEKDCGRILNSESYKDPALIILLDTRCGKVI